VAEGLYLVHDGEREQGLGLLTSALTRARQRMPVMLRDCLRALAQAYDVLGLPMQAIGHLQEAIEDTRQWQCDIALQNLRHRIPALDTEYLGNAALAAHLRGEEAALRGKVSQQELLRSPMEMLERMAVTAELRDDSTGEHCYRVGKLSALLAAQLGWEPREADRLELGARLHDIGKIGVPDEIILKRGRLTDAEREVVAAHTRVGADLLVKSNIPDIALAADIALHHHDWWDGSRSEGAKADAIPDAARIVALAEVFDALTHERAHRSAWSMREALGEISRLKGTQFEPRLADAFIALVRGIVRDHPDIDVFLGEAAKSSTFLRARSRIREALDESSRQPA
jgi:putative two-component system response regulator